MTLVFPRSGIVDYYAPVTVSISDKKFIRAGLYKEIRRTTQMIGIIATHVDPGFTDRENVFPFPRELHHMITVARAKPDETVVIEIDAMFLIKPRIAFSRTTPRL